MSEPGPRKKNVLTYPQMFAVVEAVKKIQGDDGEIMKDGLSAGELAERLTRRVGFPVTVQNLIGLGRRFDLVVFHPHHAKPQLAAAKNREAGDDLATRVTCLEHSAATVATGLTAAEEEVARLQAVAVPNAARRVAALEAEVKRLALAPGPVPYASRLDAQADTIGRQRTDLNAVQQIVREQEKRVADLLTFSRAQLQVNERLAADLVRQTNRVGELSELVKDLLARLGEEPPKSLFS